MAGLMTTLVQRLSGRTKFDSVEWDKVPDEPGVYVIHDLEEAIYVGMAGRNGRGSLRRRLRDHYSGQIVNNVRAVPFSRAGAVRAG